MKNWFRFTIRDWFWLSLLVAVSFGSYSQKYSSEQAYLKLWEEHKKVQRDHTREFSRLYDERRLLEEEFAAKNEAAINRELDLKTTVKALKLRLGEDPHGKESKPQ